MLLNLYSRLSRWRRFRICFADFSIALASRLTWFTRRRWPDPSGACFGAQEWRVLGLKSPSGVLFETIVANLAVVVDVVDVDGGDVLVALVAEGAAAVVAVRYSRLRNMRWRRETR